MGGLTLPRSSGLISPQSSRQLKASGFRIFSGRYANSKAIATPTTLQTVFTVARGLKPVAIRGIFSQGKNATGNTAAPGIQAKIAPMQSLAAGFADVPGYTAFTWNGSATATLPAAAAAGRKSYLVTDWRFIQDYPRVDTVGAPYAFSVRILLPTLADPICMSGGGNGDSFTGWTAESTGRYMELREKAGDYVTTTSGFTTGSTISTGSIFAGFEVLSANGLIYTVLSNADSNEEGREANLTGRGPTFQAAMGLSPANGMVVECANISVSGSGTAAWFQNFVDLMAAKDGSGAIYPLIPDMAVLPLGTINDVPGGTTNAKQLIQLMRFWLNQLHQKYSDYNITQLDLTWQPYNTNVCDYTTISDGVQIDLQRQQKNMADLLAGGNRIIYDRDADVRGALVNGQYQLLTSLDGIHLDTAAIARTIPGQMEFMKRAQPLLR